MNSRARSLRSRFSIVVPLVLVAVTGTSLLVANPVHAAEVKVYFGNQTQNPKSEDCGKVFPVARTIVGKKATPKLALLELLKGPNAAEAKEGYSSMFDGKESKGVLRSVNVRKGFAYVNFTKGVRKINGANTSCGGSAFIAEIESTLGQFNDIKSVFYAIDAKPGDFYDWQQVGECPKELPNCSGKNFK
jgi:spore germination protein GerM